MLQSVFACAQFGNASCRFYCEAATDVVAAVQNLYRASILAHRDFSVWGDQRKQQRKVAIKMQMTYHPDKLHSACNALANEQLAMEWQRQIHSAVEEYLYAGGDKSTWQLRPRLVAKFWKNTREEVKATQVSTLALPVLWEAI